MNRQRIAEDEDNTAETIAKTVFYAILTGVGLGVGLYIVKKLGAK